ncbi:hypothetical protein Tco_1014561 [Tanacetum coccineum]
MNSNNDMSDFYDYYTQLDMERYAQYHEYFKQYESLEGHDGESSERLSRRYIPREREVAEEKLQRDYFGDQNTPPIYPEEYFRRRKPVFGVFVYFGVIGKSGDVAPLLHDGSTDGTKLRREIPGRIVGALVVMDVGGEEHDGGNGGWKSSMMNFVIMEYLVKISKKERILELKQRHFKKLTLTSHVTPSNLSMQWNVEYPRVLLYGFNSTRSENDY